MSHLSHIWLQNPVVVHVHTQTAFMYLGITSGHKVLTFFLL